MACTILACSPHPDDIELYAGGLLLKQAAKSKIVVIDLTYNHNASNNSEILRWKQGYKIAQKYGFYARENAKIEDGKVDRYNIGQQEKIVKIICKYRPDIILLPYTNTDHPDHIESKALFERAIYKAGISNELTSFKGCYVNNIYYYLMEKICEPNILIDISSLFETKIKMIMEYRDQFCYDKEKQKTYLNTSQLNNLKRMNAFWGSKLNVEYAEAFIIKSAIVVNDLFDLYMQPL